MTSRTGSSYRVAFGFAAVAIVTALPERAVSGRFLCWQDHQFPRRHRYWWRLQHLCARDRQISRAPYSRQSDGDREEHAGCRGGATASTWLYQIAPKDGTAIGSVSPNAVLGKLFGEGRGRYDPSISTIWPARSAAPRVRDLPASKVEDIWRMRSRIRRSSVRPLPAARPANMPPSSNARPAPIRDRQWVQGTGRPVRCHGAR